jgi:hypothetical protein
MCVQAIFAVQDMMRVDYPSSTRNGRHEQTKSLLELGRHVYSDRVGSGAASQREQNRYDYDQGYDNDYGNDKNNDYQDPYWINRDENEYNWAPPEDETPSAMELRIEKLQQELTQLAEQQVLLQTNNNNNNDHTAHTIALHKPMNHSYVPSPANITFYPYLLPPPNLTHSTTVILAISAQWNFAKRQAIRETWAQGHDNVYFIVGHSNCHENNENNNENNDNNNNNCREQDHAFLMQEQLRFRDLLEVPIVEFYRGIPEKVVQAYHWVLTHLPQVRWLVKADDDMFVRVGSIETYLQKYNSNLPMLLGKIIMQAEVNREGKWEETDYPYMYYPYWPQGSAGHIMSRPTVEYICDNSPKLRRYQGEDVSIGIWLDEAKQKGKITNLQYIHLPNLVQNEGKQYCQEGTYLMIGHDMKPKDLEQCMTWNEELPPVLAWVDDSANFEPPNRAKDSAYTDEEQAPPAEENNAWGFQNIFGVSAEERKARLRQALRGGDEYASNR